MLIAAGKYVSVSSQTDADNADLARQRREPVESPGAKLEELRHIYVGSGLDRELAAQVVTCDRLCSGLSNTVEMAAKVVTARAPAAPVKKA